MKMYKVTEHNAVVLKAGTVFMAEPEAVAGALRVGAVVEIQQQPSAQPQAQTQQQAQNPPQANQK